MTKNELIGALRDAPEDAEVFTAEGKSITSVITDCRRDEDGSVRLPDDMDAIDDIELLSAAACVALITS